MALALALSSATITDMKRPSVEIGFSITVGTSFCSRVSSISWMRSWPMSRWVISRPRNMIEILTLSPLRSSLAAVRPLASMSCLPMLGRILI